MNVKDITGNKKSSSMHHTSVSGILYHSYASFVELVDANCSVDTQCGVVH
jgi:hypothetical protein